MYNVGYTDTTKFTKPTMQTTTSPNTRPKRECHKCSRNGTGDDYCWKHCLGPADDSNKGISKVSLGSIEAEAEFLYANADPLVSDRNVYQRGSFGQERSELDGNGGFPADDPEVETDSEESFFDDRQDSPDEDRSVTNDLNDDVERALVIILANLMSLSDTQLCIFRHIFHGDDLKVTGANLPVPISKQAVFKHLLKMVKANKVVAKVIHEMMRKGQGGAKRQVSQLDLFDFGGLT